MLSLAILSVVFAKGTDTILNSTDSLKIAEVVEAAANTTTTPPTTITPAKIPTMSAQEVLQIVTRIVNWFFTFLMVVVVVMVIASGYIFVTGGGDPGKVTKARQILIYALIGFTVAMIARGIIALVSMVIGKGTVDLPTEMQY